MPGCGIRPRGRRRARAFAGFDIFCSATRFSLTAACWWRVNPRGGRTSTFPRQACRCREYDPINNVWARRYPPMNAGGGIRRTPRWERVRPRDFGDDRSHRRPNTIPQVFEVVQECARPLHGQPRSAGISLHVPGAQRRVFEAGRTRLALPGHLGLGSGASCPTQTSGSGRGIVGDLRYGQGAGRGGSVFLPRDRLGGRPHRLVALLRCSRLPYLARQRTTPSLLPDGTVLCHGRHERSGVQRSSRPFVFTAELWGSDDGQWSMMTPARIPRLYHVPPRCSCRTAG